MNPSCTKSIGSPLCMEFVGVNTPEVFNVPAISTEAPKSSAARVNDIDVALALIVSEYWPTEVILLALYVWAPFPEPSSNTISVAPSV